MTNEAENAQSENEHFEKQELERLSAGEIQGDRLVEILLHLESCAFCCQNMPSIKTETLLQAIFGDDELPLDESDCQAE